MPKDKTQKIKDETYKFEIKQGSTDISDWIEVLNKDDGYWYKINIHTGEHIKMTKL